MDQTALIALLNDIAADDPLLSCSDVYFNADGQPTDRFLEALKEDLGKLPEIPPHQAEFVDSSHIAMSPPSASYAPRGGKISTERNSSKPSSQSKDKSSSLAHRRRPGRRETDSLRETTVDFEADDESDSVASSASSSTLSENCAGNRRPLRCASTPRKQRVPASPSLSLSLSAKTTKETSPAVQKSKVVSAKTSPAALSSSSLTKHTASSLQHAKTAPLAADPRRMSMQFDVEENEVDVVEREGKIKSLQLRVQGQLHTIRTLEAQLSEATQTVEAKNKIIAKLQGKIRGFAEQAQKQQEQVLRQQEESRLAESMLLLKKQASTLTTKLAEETSRRQRAEERAKMLRDYADTAKSRCKVIEGQNEELRNALQELQLKLSKYRKSYRDVASDIATHRDELSHKDEDIAKMQARAEAAEREVQHLHHQLEKCLGDITSLRHDNMQRAEHAKSLQLQLDIFKEKEKVRRAESRLRSNSNSFKSPAESRNEQTNFSPHAPSSSSPSSATGGPPLWKKNVPPKSVTTDAVVLEMLSDTPLGPLDWEASLDKQVVKETDTVLAAQERKHERVARETHIRRKESSLDEIPTSESKSTAKAADTSADNSTNTVRRLRALAERDTIGWETDSQPSMHSSSSSRANSRVDRLQQIYMKVSSRTTSVSSSPNSTQHT